MTLKQYQKWLRGEIRRGQKRYRAYAIEDAKEVGRDGGSSDYYDLLQRTGGEINAFHRALIYAMEIRPAKKMEPVKAGTSK